MPENEMTLKDALLAGYTVSDVSVTEGPEKVSVVVTIERPRPVNRFKLTIRVPDDKEEPDAEG